MFRDVTISQAQTEVVIKIKSLVRTELEYNMDGWMDGWMVLLISLRRIKIIFPPNGHIGRAWLWNYSADTLSNAFNRP